MVFSNAGFGVIAAPDLRKRSGQASESKCNMDPNTPNPYTKSQVRFGLSGWVNFASSTIYDKVFHCKKLPIYDVHSAFAIY